MEPAFIEATQGPLFTILHRPPNGGGEARGAVLYIHPFAEELNKARRMAAVQARRLAAQGYWILQPDLYGCGDSAGDFEDARWEIWLEDLERCAALLEARAGTRVTLWGLRLGAVLATDLARRHPGRCHGLLFWQPVVSGEQMLTQFLRIRLAAGIRESNSESTKDLRARLADGEPLEIGGYRLSPTLAAALDAARLEPPDTCAAPVPWLEVTGTPERGLSPVSRRTVDDWKARGVPVAAEPVGGEPFWNTQEITEVPALWERTQALLLSA